MTSSPDQPGTAGPAGGGILQLRLYVANRSPNSVRAMINLDAICRECLEEGAYRIEVVDVLADPLRAVQDKILVTPTLAGWMPAGQGMAEHPILILGDLSEHDRVLDALGLRGSG
jgi:circadian clock protein KaiB